MEAIVKPSRVCAMMRPTLKYLITILVVDKSVFMVCKVSIAIFSVFYFIKWLAYLGLILDSGNITSISAVLK